MDIFTLNHATFTYPNQDRPAVEDVTLTLSRGEFFTLCGPSGGGKTTLLRLLKPQLTPHGTMAGTLLFQDTPLHSLDKATVGGDIGFVLQQPQEQIVTDKVWHELAFGLENLGLSQDLIRARVAEMACFFGIGHWFHRDTASLSGGEMQLLNLAAVMALNPKVLLLDEPTSQLDPIAARHFLDCLGRLNREMGITILLSEHRLEDALPLSHRCGVLEGGQLVALGTPAEVGALLAQNNHPMARAMPTPMQVWGGTGDTAPCPLTVGEGAQWLASFARAHPLHPLPPSPLPAINSQEALGVSEVWFRYTPTGEDVLRGLSLSVPRGSLFALLGGNGAGKSTLLTLLSAAKQPQRGRATLLGRPLAQWDEHTLFRNCLAVLPQDPRALFVCKTALKELQDISNDQVELQQVVTFCRLSPLLARHPYDLSGGEQQRLALAKVLLTRPKVLLLDEPTKGLDVPFQEELARMLHQLCTQGITVVMVSHDVEFCARYATHCALLFDGVVTAQGTPHTFFSQNRFYTTAASRMGREIAPLAITPQDLLALCTGTVPPPSPVPQQEAVLPPTLPTPLKKPHFGGLIGLCALLLCALAGILAWQGSPWLAGLSGGAWLPSLLWLGVAALGLWLLGLGRTPLNITPPPPMPTRPAQRRVWMVCLLVLAPLTLLAGTYLLGDRKYYFISLLLLLLAVAPLLIGFERSVPNSRQLVLLSILTALAVAGRGAFFMLPQFKPVAAVVVLTGLSFGPQGGFLVGAASMLVSNFFYVQGAWTPWQMAGMGLVGLFAGLLSRWVGRSRLSLCLYGLLAPILFYGGLINPASLLMYQPNPSLEMLVTTWVLGFPFDLVHGGATAFFLWLGGPALLASLGRVREKYNLN